MKVVVKGKGEVNLTQQNFVATGGQASVYVKSGVAYKIYTDPKDMIPDAKFRALSTIADPHVIKPDLALLDGKNVPIGYTMQAVKNTISLCQLFTKAFRDRNNVTNDHIVDVTAKLLGHIDNVHRAGVIIVDLNELNILVPGTFDEVFLIDVDSYQTPGYPATVIMPSVRDYSVHAKDFSPLSDWFSFGILAFQLFVGAHPYKGTHPGTANIAKDQRMEHRMRNRISAFRSDVSLPKCCYDFNTIPQNFRDWLKAVLEDGKRLHPPDPRGGPAAVIVTQMAPLLVGSGNLTITEVTDFETWHLVEYVESSGSTLALISQMAAGVPTTRVMHDGHVVQAEHARPGTTLIGFTPKYNLPVGFNLYEGRLTYLDFTRKTAETLDIQALEIAKSGDRFYVRNADQVLEIEFSELPNKTLVTASHAVANTLELASHLYEGVAVQNMLGSIFVSLFPRSKAGYQVRIPQLDRYKIVDAKFDGGVLMIVGAKDGQYDRMVFRFDEDYNAYDVRVVPDITPSGLNFITLASGVCISLTEEEKLEVFSAKKDSQGLKVVEDKALGNDMRLLKVNGKVGFERGGKIYQMSLK